MRSNGASSANPRGTGLIGDVLTHFMNADRNLLFGVLALQADILSPEQFINACTLWTTRKRMYLADLLIELGWITPTDKADIDRLVERKLRKYAGDAKPGLAVLSEDVRRSLVALQDADIQCSLAGLPPASSTLVTVDHIPGPSERYRLNRLHAAGGIGRVWLARDNELGRDVALKELRPECGDNPTLYRRFVQEARITGQLEHPGIVPIYELVQQSGNQQAFYTMRFLKGRTLSEAARTYHHKRLAGQAESLELLNLLNSFVTVCYTLAYAHSRGVIHRDLKGNNIVLGNFGEVVVLDWGLAKLLDQAEGETSDIGVVDPVGASDGDLTVQGQTLGTPGYMAPEQAVGQPDLIDRRTDVYGLGAILYEILTGQAPFTGSDTCELLRKVREEAPLSPRQLCSDVPPALESICLRALAKDPADRYASATDLAQEVQKWQEVERKQAEEELNRFFSVSLEMLCIAGFDGYFKRLNPSWEKTLGWTTEELMAKPYLDFVHPDDRAATIAEAQKIAEGAATITYENRYRCKDGSYKWMLWIAIPDAIRQVIYAAARDITERRRVEKELRESQERYRSVIAAMREGVVLLDSDGRILACNASAEGILGLSTDQVVGRTSLDPRWGAIHENGSPFPGETFPAMVTLRSGQPCTNVIMGVRKPDGVLTWISVNSQPLFQADGTTLAGVVASFEDITDRKRTEETLRQTAAELAHARQKLQWRKASRPRA